MTEVGLRVDKTLMEKVSKLGEINIRFYRVDVKEEGVMNNIFDFQEDNNIPEQALKGKALSRKAGFVSTCVIWKLKSSLEKQFVCRDTTRGNAEDLQCQHD